jgi:predicted secreted protein
LPLQRFLLFLFCFFLISCNAVSWRPFLLQTWRSVTLVCRQSGTGGSLKEEKGEEKLGLRRSSPTTPRLLRPVLIITSVQVSLS